MDSYYSSNFSKLGEEAKRSVKLMDSGELNRSSKHIDSGVCVESLSSISSILTSSSLSSSYSSKKSTKSKNSHINDEPVNSNSSTPSKYAGQPGGMLMESVELYEYDYNENEDDSNQYVFKAPTNYELIKGRESINQPYLTDDDLLDTDKDGNTMLHLAIIEHKTQLAYHIISLFKHPDYLDIRNNWSQTALHLACLTGQTKVVRHLIACGATINLIDSQGNTSLHSACRNGDLNLVRQFFQPISKNETSNLNYKVAANDINFKKFILNEKNFEGENCIFIAAESGNFELIKYLVHEGAEINAQELKDGNTVLHLAVRLKSVDLIEFLIEKCGAHINKVNYSNQTPLNLAWNMLNGNPNSRRIKIMIHLLKESGGEPVVYDSESSDELYDSSTGELSD